MTNSKETGADGGLVWREAGDFKPGIKTEGCWFEHNGQRYCAFRDTAGNLLSLSKRARTNGRGVFYERLNLKGAAARKVIAAVFSSDTNILGSGVESRPASTADTAARVSPLPASESQR